MVLVLAEGQKVDQINKIQNSAKTQGSSALIGASIRQCHPDHTAAQITTHETKNFQVSGHKKILAPRGTLVAIVLIAWFYACSLSHNTIGQRATLIHDADKQHTASSAPTADNDSTTQDDGQALMHRVLRYLVLTTLLLPAGASLVWWRIVHHRPLVTGAATRCVGHQRSNLFVPSCLLFLPLLACACSFLPVVAAASCLCRRSPCIMPAV